MKYMKPRVVGEVKEADYCLKNDFRNINQDLDETIPPVRLINEAAAMYAKKLGGWDLYKNNTYVVAGGF